MSSASKSTPSPSRKGGSGNMTRAVVANLNRQRAASNEGQHYTTTATPPANGAISYYSDHTSPSTVVPSTPSPSNSPSSSRNNNNHLNASSSTPPKSLPPKPSPLKKTLPHVPEFFVVRPPPKSSSVKAERNDRRIFLNTETLETIKISYGSVVLIQRHYPRGRKYLPKRTCHESSQSNQDTSDDEDEDSIERSTVGIACPMSRIEPNVARMANSLRESAGLTYGDEIVITPYRAPIEEAKEIVLQQDESADAPAEREPLRYYLQDELLQQARYVAVGMKLECAYRGVLRGFVVTAITGPDRPDRSSLAARLENLHISSSSNPPALSGIPIVFSMTRATNITFAGSKDVLQDPSSQQEPVTYSSIGGLKDQIESLRDMIEMPLLRPHLFVRFGMKPPRGVLLYGPPGTGKTLLLRATANEVKANVLTINGPSVVSKYQGETESTLRGIFREAQERQPSIIFIDEIDALAPKRGADNDSAVDVSDGRVVATLLTLMDGMEEGGRVVIVAATNRPNAIDPALRRPGRFDKELEIGIPDANARLEILRLHLIKMPHTLLDTYVQSVAAKTHGYVGADLMALCTEAGMRCIKNGIKNNLSESSMKITQEDIEAALLVIRPSAMREVFLETPKVRWDDIGGQELVKRKLREAVEWPITRPASFSKLGITPPKGVLLYGPPGCSKTLIAKALATETGLNFLSVKGPEIFNKYVGESERQIRDIFKKARAASPSIIFFDEIDAMTTSRGVGGGSVNDRILTALLTEMDGIETLVNVTILAATNRPDVIDSALLRPGRIDRIMYVGPPDLEARAAIFRIEFRKMAVAADVDADELAAKTEGCSGADITALCRDAGLQAMHDDIDATEIKRSHFDTALKAMVRSIGVTQLGYFEAFRLNSGVQSIP